MAIIDGWVYWADRSIKGHPEKVYSKPNAGLGIICHSIVGDLPGHAVPHRFLADDREPGNPARFTPYAAASVQFIVYRDGHLRQLYPVTASTWTSGGPEANTGYWSIEAEGGYPDNDEPLTDAAITTLRHLFMEFTNHTGRELVPGDNLLGHRDAAKRWGYEPTACPSRRYDELFYMMSQEGKQMLADLLLRIERLERVLAGHGGLEVTAAAENMMVLATVTKQQVAPGDKYVLEREQAMQYLDLMGNNMWLGLANTQAKLADHISNHASGTAGPVPEHSHEVAVKVGKVVRL